MARLLSETSLSFTAGRILVEDPQRGGRLIVHRISGEAAAGQAIHLEGAHVSGLLPVGLGAKSTHFVADRFSVDWPLIGTRPFGGPKVRVDGGAVQPFKGLALTGINGELIPQEQGTLSLDVSGSYGGRSAAFGRPSGPLPRRQNPAVGLLLGASWT